VIEYAIVDDIDLNGWDVRKALRLFWKSNPAFLEWVQSTIVYEQRPFTVWYSNVRLGCERGHRSIRVPDFAYTWANRSA
jgi:predicted nucleotidyltransferase